MFSFAFFSLILSLLSGGEFNSLLKSFFFRFSSVSSGEFTLYETGIFKLFFFVIFNSISLPSSLSSNTKTTFRFEDNSGFLPVRVSLSICPSKRRRPRRLMKAAITKIKTKILFILFNVVGSTMMFHLIDMKKLIDQLIISFNSNYIFN